MRFRHVGGLASVLVAVACATGEDIPSAHVTPVDAGPMPITMDGTGGAAGESTSSGGMTTASGGDDTGGSQADGGSSSTDTGGTTSANGGTSSGGTTSASGGKTSSSGGTTSASGGTTSTAGGGGKASGGTSSGGTTGTGGMTGDGGSCQTGQKFCGGLCTPPAPRVGCGLTGCDACTTQAPQNGYVTCTNNQCAFDCLSGYTKMGDSCVGSGAGGGSSGNCNVSKCPVCNVVSGPACCTNDGKCGCPAIPWVTPTCATPI